MTSVNIGEKQAKKLLLKSNSGARVVSQLVEELPRMNEALSSTPIVA